MEKVLFTAALLKHALPKRNQMNKPAILLLILSFLTGLAGCGRQSNSDENQESVRTRPLKDSPTPYTVADADRTRAVDELVELRREMLALEGMLIAPAQEDLDQYADFLKDPTTGLARLFPRGSGNERRPLLVNGGGAYYQFKGRTNEYGFGSDVEYSTRNSPRFSVGSADFGFFAQIGKFDIRRLDERNPVIGFALSYPSPNGRTKYAWRAERRKWSGGVANGGITFKDQTEAVVGMSYVIRSVNESYYDIVAIFQVVRRDPTDGSLIIAWKLLKEFDKPVLKRD